MASALCYVRFWTDKRGTFVDDSNHMDHSSEYLERANECEQDALLMKNQRIRSELEDLSRLWRKLAELASRREFQVTR